MPPFISEIVEVLQHSRKTGQKDQRREGN